MLSTRPRDAIRHLFAAIFQLFTPVFTCFLHLLAMYNGVSVVPGEVSQGRALGQVWR